MFHCTNNVLYMYSPHYCAYKSKQQQTVTFNNHAIIIYVPITNMPTKCLICQLCHVQISDNFIWVYKLHMNSLQSTVWPGTLVYIHFILLESTPEQICLLHCTYMSHCTSTVVYIQTTHCCTHPSKVNILQCIFTVYVYAPQMPYICHMPNYLTCTNGGCTPIYSQTWTQWH